MARVTIEDCSAVVPSRFELVILAAQRAKEIGAGAPMTVERDNDKNAVIALRELAAGNLSPDALRESVVKKFQKRQASDNVDRPDEDLSEDQMEITSEMKSYQDTSDAEELFEEEVIDGEEKE